MSYEGPIQVTLDEAVTKFNELLDGSITALVTEKYRIKVDKDKLFKALRYDSGQYQSGYFNGYMARLDEQITCKDCKYHNGNQCKKHIGVWFDEEYCSSAERKEE